MPKRLPGSREEDSWLSERQLSGLTRADQADELRSPVPTQVVSNGEYFPLPQTLQQRQVELRIAELATEASRRLGMSRRRFLASSGGMAAAFLAMNEVFGRFFDVNPLELMGSAHWGDLLLTLRYNHIDATFRSSFLAASPNNSTADANGAITVNPGDRIPGTPADSAKLRAEFNASDRWTLGGTVAYASSQYAHGDENNRDSHGRVPGYTVTNLDTQFQLAKNLQLFANVTNLFDRRYQNFGLLGANAFTGPDRTFGPALGIEPVAEQFRGLGSPRGFWIGLRYTFANTHRDG